MTGEPLRPRRRMLARRTLAVILAHVTRSRGAVGDEGASNRTPHPAVAGAALLATLALGVAVAVAIAPAASANKPPCPGNSCGKQTTGTTGGGTTSTGTTASTTTATVGGTTTADTTTTANTTTTGTTTATTTTTPAPPGSSRIYWGARVESQFTGVMPPWDMTAQSDFESTDAGGKGASLMHWGAPFMSPGGSLYGFDSTAANNVLNHGAISVYDWAPYQDGQGVNEPRFSLAAVIAGNWDSYVRSWFQSVKTWGHPIFLRFAWEMNIQAWPWSEGVNGNTAGQYVQAWRHVHDVAASVGATNVTWVWCPNNSPSNNYAEFYPGDAYVDWTCVDGYNWGTDPAGHQLGWQSFDQVFHSAYQAVLAVAPSKPIMIGETASVESGGSKAAWITDMLTTQLPNNYPKVKALMWFDCNYGDGLWPLESSSTAEAAFRSGIQSPYYAANSYSSQNTSPIPIP